MEFYVYGILQILLPKATTCEYSNSVANLETEGIYPTQYKHSPEMPAFTPLSLMCNNTYYIF